MKNDLFSTKQNISCEDLLREKCSKFKENHNEILKNGLEKAHLLEILDFEWKCNPQTFSNEIQKLEKFLGRAIRIERTLIDLEEFDRKVFFNFYNSFQRHFWSVTTEIDVTNLVNYAKSNHISFYGLMSYFVLKTCLNVPAFLFRFEQGKIFKYNSLTTQFTTLIKRTCNSDISRRLNFDNNLEIFLKNFVALKTETEEERIPPHPVELFDNSVFISCQPWFSFSQFEPILNLTPEDSVPRLTWDKYHQVDDKYFMNLSFCVDHRFIDGYHIHLFLEKFNELTNEI